MPAILSQLVGRFSINRDFINLKLSMEKLGAAGEEFITNITPSFRTKNINDHKFKRTLLKLLKKLKQTLTKIKRKIISLLPDKLLGASRQISTTLSGSVFKPLKKRLKKIFGPIFEPIKQAFFDSKIGKIFKNPELEKQRKLALFFVGMMIILIPVAFLILKKPKETAAWFNDDWLYRKKINITNNTGDESDSVVYFDGADVLDTSDSDKFNSDCSDIRFVTANGQVINYHIESGCGTSSTKIQLFFENFKSGSQDIYMYYGNKNANKTFIDESYLVYRGDGGDGAVTFTGDTNLSVVNTGGRSCADGGDMVDYNVSSLSPTSATLTATPSSGCLSSGDTILLLNMQGSSSDTVNVGNYELLEIESVTGDTINFTFDKYRFYGSGYTDDEDLGTGSANQRVVAQRIPNYTNVTLNTGAKLYPDSWDGTSGGILAFVANGTVTVNGTIDVSGIGYRNRGSRAVGYGGESFCNLQGGMDGEQNPAYDTAWCGGGAGGDDTSVERNYDYGSPTGGGGGGGGAGYDASTSNYSGGGGGAGYGTFGNGGGGYQIGKDGSGDPIQVSGDGAPCFCGGGTANQRGGGGGGGGTYGNSALTDIFLGSAGGTGGCGRNSTACSSGSGGGIGGYGAGIVFINADTLTVNGQINSDGNDGGAETAGTSGGGGGGSGGSIKLSGDTLTLGSLVTASGGSGGAGDNAGLDGGAAGDGRIKVDYMTSVSGTTSPNYVPEEHIAEGTDYSIGTPGAEENGPGPVLYWQLDEATGTVANDESSMNNDGTITNSSWRQKDLCLIGTCLSMDGSNDYVSVADNNTIDFGGSDSFTIQAWIRHPTQTDGSSDAIISKVSPSVGGGVGTRTNIDDASDFATNMPTYYNDSSNLIFRKSDGTLYALLNQTSFGGGDVEMWTSSDGSSWSEKDASGGPTNVTYFSGAIDSSGIIHIAYVANTGIPPSLDYITFDTSDDTFGSSTTLETPQALSLDTVDDPSIDIDSSDVPHVSWTFYDQSPSGLQYVRYRNKVGGVWNVARNIENQSGNTNYEYTDITINEDDIPEVAYIDTNNSYLSAAVGNANNATSFTTHDPDTNVRTDSYPSIGVDSNGDTWISYLDENGATDYISLIHHTDGSGWTTWDVPTTDSDAGNDVSVAVDSSDVYLFYEDDNNDILFNKYTAASGWEGEEVVESVGTNEYVKARWQFNNNPSYATYGIDFIYSDGDDIWWNTLDPSAEIVESETKGYEIYMESDGDIVFGIDDDNTGFPEDSVTSASADFDDGQWHMVTGVKDGIDSMKLYIDGELIDTDSSISAVGSLATSKALNVGRRVDMNIRNFSGFIDEVKVYPYARTADEVLTDYATGKAGHSGSGSAAVFGSKDTFLTRGLVGYWKMDEDTWVSNCSASDALDSSGYINDLKSCGGSGLTSGKYGGGANFDGSQDYLVVDSQVLGGTDEVSFGGWIKPTNSNDQYILEQISAHFTIEIESSAWKVRLQNSSNESQTATGGTVTTGSWQHVMGVYDGEKIRLYVNGSEVANTSQTGSVRDTSNGFILGCNGNVSEECLDNEFTGQLDEIRIYNRALSAAEVSDLSSWAPGPVGYWKLDERRPVSSLDDSSGYENDLTPINFGNYFGDASDGIFTVSADTELVVLNKSGTNDGDMVIREYDELTINSGYQLTTDQPGRGMFLYIDGDLQVDGTLSMTARGAYADPDTAGASDNAAVPDGGLKYPVLLAGGTDDLTQADFAGVGSTAVNVITGNQTNLNGEVKLYSLPKVGASGGAGKTSAGAGNDGSNGSGTQAAQTGGGGSGGSSGTNDSGAGGDGSVFSGGAGSGAAHWGVTDDGSDVGGPGSAGIAYYSACGGGAGNDGGNGHCSGCGGGEYANDGDDGTGGLMILVVKGDVTVGAGGSIQANGTDGGDANYTSGGGDEQGGGASGGGSIMILYGGTYTNNGTVEAVGGTGGSAANGRTGGDGGDGTIITGPLDTVTEGKPIDERKWTIGKYSSAFDFKEVYDTYLSRTDPSDFDFTADDSFTLEAWAKTSNSGETTYLISKYDDTNAGYKLYHSSTGNYCFGIDDDATWTPDDEACTTGKNYGDGEWHHIVGLKDGTSSIKIYVDGKLGGTDSSIAATGTLANTGDFLVGIDSDEQPEVFNGELDDIRVYNYARSLTQITEDMNAGHPAPGSPIGSTKLHLKFDEMQGDTAYDSSPEGNHGNLAASGTTCPGDDLKCPAWTLDGRFNSALDFGSTGDFVTLSNPTSEPGTNDFSISTWIKTSDNAINAHIINASWYNYGILGTTAGLVQARAGNKTDAVVYATSTTNIEDNAWHHIVVTYDRDGDMTLYVDKVAEDDNDISSYSTYDYDESTVNIGNRAWVGNENQGWMGQIDDFRIYHSVLTQEQVNLLYNNGASAVLGATGTDSSGNPVYSASRSYCPPGDATVSCAPLAEWKLDENQGVDTVYDTSGNGKNLTAQGFENTTWDRGENGRGVGILNTDGQEYMELADDSDFDFAGSDDFTIEGWFKHDTQSQNIDVLVSKRTLTEIDVGDGGDGDVTFSSDTDINATNTISGRSCADGGDAVSYSVDSLTSTTATLTSSPSSGCLDPGDDVLLINLQGNSSDYTNVGNYETLEIDKISGSTITFTGSKSNYYGSGASDDNDIGTASTEQRVMLMRVPSYDDVTVNTGVRLYSSKWDGTTDGVLAFKATGTVSVNGTLDTNYKGYRDRETVVKGYGGESFCSLMGGSDSGSAPGSGTAFCGGGAGGEDDNSDVQRDYGAPTGGGGGGGGDGKNAASTNYAGGGGGAGYGTQGTGGGGYSTGLDGSGDPIQTSGDGGVCYCSVTNHNRGGGGGGGGSYGVATLSDIYLGSAGGGGGCGRNSTACTTGTGGGFGGDGGGIVLINADAITINGQIESNGQNGTNMNAGSSGSGGGGAGGSIKLSGGNLDIGSTLVAAGGGSGGTSGRNGGSGGNGRIRLEYITSVSGESDPTYSSTTKSGPGRGYAVYMESDGDITFGIDDDDSSFPEDSATSTAATYDDGKWHYFAAVKDGTSSIKLYIDGVLVAQDATLSATGSLATSESLYIGADKNGNGTWAGGLDNIKIFNYAKTPEQIAWTMNRGKPTGRWKLDECSGTVAHDTSGLGNHGTITIGALGDQTSVGTCESSGAWFNGASGKLNYSLNFDGSDDFITLDSETFNPGLGDFSLSAWVKTDNLDDYGEVISGGAYVYELFADSNGYVTAAIGNQTDAWTFSTSTTSIEDDEWHHLLATFDRDGYTTLYIDGKAEEDTDDISGYASQNLAPTEVGIGHRYNSVYEWKGQIDDVKIFPYVLSTQQILSEYKGGAVSFN